MNRESRARAAASAFVVVTLLAVAAYWDELSAWFASPEAFREHILALGAFGPVVSVLLSALQVVVAPIPGQLVGVANGYLYGVWIGVAISMVGLVLGSAIAMGLGRLLGRGYVERHVSPENLAKFDGITERHGALFFFLVFLVPFLPDDVACFAIGLSKLSIGRMLAVSFFGRLPGMLAACVFGAYAVELPLWAKIGSAVLTTLVVLVLIRRGDAIEARLMGRIRKETRASEPPAPNDSAATGSREP